MSCFISFDRFDLVITEIQLKHLKPQLGLQSFPSRDEKKNPADPKSAEEEDQSYVSSVALRPQI